MTWMIDITALMILPVILLSFWRISRSTEFQALKDSGQAISLRMSTLHAGYMRPAHDPLRASHIRLARIGFAHWAMMLAGFFGVFALGMGRMVLGL